MYSCIHHNNPADMETLRNIDIPLVSSLLTLKNFDTWCIQDFFPQNVGQCRTMKDILVGFAGQF